MNLTPPTGYKPGDGPLSIMGADAAWHVERLSKLDWLGSTTNDPQEARVLRGLAISRANTLSRCVDSIWACSQKGE